MTAQGCLKIESETTFVAPARAGPTYAAFACTVLQNADAIGDVDAVLLSHDQHADNLDHAGRDFLNSAGRVLTTVAGAKRLDGHAEGLAPWAATAQLLRYARLLIASQAA